MKSITRASIPADTLVKDEVTKVLAEDRRAV